MLSKQKITGLISGPGLFFLFLLLPVPDGLSQQGMLVAATAMLMAALWITEAIPIPLTALIPVALFPMKGVLDVHQIVGAYTHHLIFLFLGGFLIAATLEKWNLHLRIALHTLRFTGTTPAKLLFGFMLATAFLSMWISNTAAALLMVTIAAAVIRQLEPGEKTQCGSRSLATVLMLGIAYSASIGGIATLIGTPPNAILAAIVEQQYGISIHFIDWMKIALPLSLSMLLITWAYLRMSIPSSNTPTYDFDVSKQIGQLGRTSSTEKRVLVIFLLVVCGWLFQGLIPTNTLLRVSDAGIAMVGALLLFLTPAKKMFGPRLLDLKTAKSIPWDILILFGGGLALAEGFSESGLTLWVAAQFSVLRGIDIIMLIGMIVLVVVFLTEVTSNTATASILLPIMGSLAIALHLHPFMTMVAVALSASFAFMLPVATPPNAIVFASRKVTIAQMAQAGFALNIIGAILITLYIVYLVPLITDLSLPAASGG
ncbi:MAG: DASS family sodium-coupled anion symporter [Gammaproteobacteria bacterium]|nr:DASS family sodium-coupled anion symporter [Gammaproteobacteria bacterium]